MDVAICLGRIVHESGLTFEMWRRICYFDHFSSILNSELPKKICIELLLVRHGVFLLFSYSQIPPVACPPVPCPFLQFVFNYMIYIHCNLFSRNCVLFLDFSLMVASYRVNFIQGMKNMQHSEQSKLNNLQ